MALSLKVLLTLFAVVGVAMVTTVYALLIRRGRFMSTTAMYPIKAIEANTGNLLSSAWPSSSNISQQGDFSSTHTKEAMATGLGDRERSFQDAITLFYLGKMKFDKTPARVAKGIRQCSALPLGNGVKSRLWLTSGSPTMKCTVQLLIWEWVSLWLMLLMLVTILIYNGFFTNELNLDSYPRLVITVIYALAFFMHAYNIWRIGLAFFTKVAAGSAWSLIERANFAIAETDKLQTRNPGQSFEFRSIDKASEEHIPKTFAAHFKHETSPTRTDSQETAVNSPTSKTPPLTDEYLKDLAAAHKALLATQVTERDIARTAANDALARVISNAMIMMGITLSCGFCSWTTPQVTANTPNNFSSAQIGSLALLASLSTGAATMFSSVLNLSIMESCFHTILSLRELRINGQAVEHYKKREFQYERVAFLDGRIPLSPVRFWDVLTVNQWGNFLAVLFMGPAFGLLPGKGDYERRSETAGFDLRVRVRRDFVLLTTRETGGHETENGKNVEVINVCWTG